MKSRIRLPHVLSLWIIATVWLLPQSAPAVAQTALPPQLQIASQPDGLRITWQGSITVGTAGTPQIAGWPLVEVSDKQLPAQLVSVQLSTSDPVTPRITQLASARWMGTTTTVSSIVPQTTNGDARPSLVHVQAGTLPSSPVVVLREGRMRGARIAVLAISPIFADKGGTRATTSLDVTIPHASLLTADAAHLLATTTPFLAATPAPDSRAALPAVRIRVAHAGIQRITGAQLAAAGIDLSTLDPAYIHLRSASTEVALEERDTGNHRLAATDELRFYAPTPGDRWNATDTYWLTVEGTSGLRMPVAPTLATPATSSATAREHGSWRHNVLYDSTLRGPDDDHWFTADLRTGPGVAAATTSVPLTSTLPLVAGTTVLTITGSAYTAGNHNLSVAYGTTTQTFTWNGNGNWSWTASFLDNVTAATLTLNPGAAPDGIELDGVTWERSVRLDFGGQGAWFAPFSGMSAYQLSATSPDRTLYDITDSHLPSVITLPDSPNPAFTGRVSARAYLLAGPSTLYLPEVSAYTPTNLATPMQADTIYIAPVSFLAALGPLKALRETQGHTVALVDVQTIYDSWSNGAVSPEAIRSFLRYAAATWTPAPVAVTLVGDGTSDPLQYKFTPDLNNDPNLNLNIIPPYLAMVDPWQGEAACETCYAQLDGDNPLDDVLPDLALGRLPVKSVAELTALVNKLIGYDTAPTGNLWRSRIAYIADNYRETNGTTDPAGDFAAFADQSIAQQPAGLDIRRMYYDPTAETVPWREPNAVQAHLRTIGMLNSGAAIVNYIGHSHWWQWAVTDVTATDGLLDLYDPDGLTNGASLSVFLEMTCLTSSFEHPSYRSGTTIDERLLLNPTGGAAAIWGPTGLGVAHGHDALQRGFYNALWSTQYTASSAPVGRRTAAAPLGTLTQAGYLELFTHGKCCLDAVRTFALLGDPFTTLRVQTGSDVYLPIVRR